MDAQNVIAAIRDIRRTTFDPAAQRSLGLLERDIAPVDQAAFTLGSAIVGFDTILGYLAQHEPTMLELTYDPIHDTVRDGKRLSNRARKRGLPILRVSAPAHIKARYPKVTHVNAYPTHLLAEYFTE